MEGIRRLLASPVSTDSTKGTEHAPLTGLWQGHGVQTIPIEKLLSAHAGGNPADVENVTKLIGKHYGSYVQGQLSRRLVDQKTVGDRDISKLGNDARKMLQDVQKTNRKNVDLWIKQGLVRDIYEGDCQRPWQSVPIHERRHLREGVTNHLKEHKELLYVDRVGDDTAKYMEQHRSLFACSAPMVANYLEAEDQGLPVLPGYLRQWAEERYDPAMPSPDGKLSRMGLALARNVDVYTNRTAKMLYESPLEKMATTPLGQQRAEARAHAKELVRAIAMVTKHGAHLPDELRAAMASDLRGQFRDSIAHIRRLGVLEANNPINQRGWQTFKQNELAAAIEVLLHEEQMLARKPSLTNNEAQRYNRISVLLDQLDRHYDLVATGKDGDQAPGGAAPKFGALPIRDARTYKKLVLRKLVASGMNYREASKKLQEALINRLSRVQWQVIDKQMNVQVAGKNHKLRSRIVPACHFQIHVGKKGGTDIFPVHLKGTGRPSLATAEKVHAVNFGESELSVEVDGEEQKLFKGLRSATLTAYGIKKKQRREKANESRAQELVLGALKQQLEKNPDLLRSGESIPLRLSTTSLLTPDRTRHHTHYHDDELKMQREQLEALNNVQMRLAAGEPLPFTDSNNNMHQVQVDLQLAVTNFGVNNMALKGVYRHAAGAWGVADEINKKGLQTLMGPLQPGEPVQGWVGEYLAGPAPANDKAIVRQLVEQIRDLYETGEYKSEGEDAYKMAERVIFLSYKIGVIPHYSCKSGKDRTGEADVAVKRLAITTEALGYVPSPRQPINQEERVLSQVMLLESGGIEWLRNSVNWGGFKTKNGKKRVGDSVFDITHQPNFDTKEQLFPKT